MAGKWTKEQQTVIDLRDCNILVSAAAGSGKTAVLVERIIRRILQKDHPIDIDRLLVVTFTNAAAAEMRERIIAAIEEACINDPDNRHLARQASLVHNAKITTIHSFCQSVIRNYFHKIDIEPTFRIADEGEIALLKGDVLDALLLEKYEEADSRFLTFIEKYASGKTDDAVREYILSLYEFSQSYPWPEEWLDACVKQYEIADEQELLSSKWMMDAMEIAWEYIDGWIHMLNEALAICEEADGPHIYAQTIEQYIQMMQQMHRCETYEAMKGAFESLRFERLKANRDKSVNADKAEEVKDAIAKVKKAAASLQKDFFTQSPQQIFTHIKNVAPQAAELTELCKQFTVRFSEEKKERNIVDFGDLEHFALQILVDKKKKEPTDVADDYAKFFEEVMVDEYQDSNYIQETILSSVSKERFKSPNRFMVGDVKQSIYRFRLARPEIFVEKYRAYQEEEGKDRKVELHKNFRSRPQVLSFTNDLFYRIMQENMGNIVYDDAAALYPGAIFPESNGTSAYDTEVYVVEKGEETQPRLIAGRIRQMMGPDGLNVSDAKGGLRPLRYRDIVILMRSLTDADAFARVLMEEGIPAYTQSRSGYFETLEIRTILSMMRIMDNPKQDIALAAVLHSPIGGFDAAQMAAIRNHLQVSRFHECVFSYAEHGEDETLKKKVCDFLEMTDTLRRQSEYLTVHELLEEMLRVTGYAMYVRAMPGGEQKMANIDLLIEKAIAFEGMSYHGLFQFVRYIESLQKRGIDSGEADVVGENADAVAIMSIHKSKGLEYPVVFVANMSKRFSKKDYTSKVVLHPDDGIGLEDIDETRRTRIPTQTKRIINLKNKKENLGEELRILYVALTRAKEKLILVGTGKTDQNYPKRGDATQPVTFFERMQANCYYDWVLPAIAPYADIYPVQTVTAEELMQQQVEQVARQELTKDVILAKASELSKEEKETFEQEFTYRYPYLDQTAVPSKMSVTELKMRAMRDADEDAYQVFEEQETKEAYVPTFIRKRDAALHTESGMMGQTTDAPFGGFMPSSRASGGAVRGSAIHRALECLDFAGDVSVAGIRAQLEKIRQEGRMTKEECSLVRARAMADFFASSLGTRMIAAQRAHKLYKEQPFVMGIEGREIEKHAGDELVLVQGIIDAFFEEEDGVVLVDYKTDQVMDKKTLADRYRMQLELYEKAVERTMNRNVKEKILYSFALQEEIRL